MDRVVRSEDAGQRGWKSRQWGIVVRVARVVANKLSSVDGFGVRDCGALMRRFGVASRREVHGILVKYVCEEVESAAIFLCLFLVSKLGFGWQGRESAAGGMFLLWVSSGPRRLCD